MSSLDLIEGIVYINLQKRKDRNKSLLQEIQKLKIDPAKVFRIEAFEEAENGTRACLKSHIKALHFASKKQWKNVLVLEDDVIFSKSLKKITSYVHSFFSHFDRWDVFFLGTEIGASKPTNHSFYVQILFAVRAHAYLVNGPYIESLKVFYEKVYASMKKDKNQEDSKKKALDKEWIHLQMKDLWFSGKSVIAFQKSDFSDIDQKRKGQR